MEKQVIWMTTLHRHPLILFEKKLNWFCDGIENGKDGCKSGMPKEFKKHSIPKYRCLRGCNFTLCSECVMYYNTPDKFDPMPLLKKLSIDSNIGAIHTVLHRHPVVLASKSKKEWCCDGIGYGKDGCLSKMKKKMKPRKRDRFKCIFNCNFNLCKKCVLHYEDVHFKKYSIPSHPHKIIKLQNQIEWYCENVSNGTCARNMESQFEARNHSYFKCSEGCNYTLCDLCYKREKKKQKQARLKETPQSKEDSKINSNQHEHNNNPNKKVLPNQPQIENSIPQQEINEVQKEEEINKKKRKHKKSEAQKENTDPREECKINEVKEIPNSKKKHKRNLSQAENGDLKKKLKKKKKKRIPSLESQEENSNVCIICMEQPKNATFVHGETGHSACCLKCAKRLFKANKCCPICQCEVNFVIRNFVI